ncbi:MAG: hypothetical protein MI919_09500, partial [Holophagales bacterium]|nr:hypothetical protein [Holophagales bacterium]
MPWRPLLEDDLARGAERALVRIASGLPAVDVAELVQDPDGPWQPVGLGQGAAGQALFWGYLAARSSEEEVAETAEACLDRMADDLVSRVQGPDLYAGIAGAGWVHEHLEQLLFEPDDEDPIQEIDEALLAHLAHDHWEGHFDLISGLAGIGIYALERIHRPKARQCLERVVAHLESLAEERPEGIVWHTPPELVPPHQREELPQGYDNLGVAHGVPGVLPVLAAACRAEVAAERARPLLEGGTRWLLAQRTDDGFPFHIVAGVPSGLARSAWCYGDPGVAATLLVAARAVGEPEWEREALALARWAARRPEETAEVRDGCLCHGGGGLAHMFNRLYQATGDEVFRDTALGWYRSVLAGREPGQGVGGF